MADAANVDTRRSAGRRPVRLASLDDLAAEIDRVERAARAGRLRVAGNWTAGRTLGHLAAWIGFGYDGYPSAMRPPLPLRLAGRLMKRRMLRGAMPAGVRFPGVSGGTYATDQLPFDEGLARMRRALELLRSGQAPPHPSPMFGAWTHDEFVRINLRHAELHLSFLHPEEGS